VNLQVENKRSVTICAGVGQSGKSTFAFRYLINGDFTARFIFDPEGEAAQRLQLAPARDVYDLGLALCSSGGWVIFDPHTLFPGRVADGCAFFCEWTFEMASRLPGQKVLMVDEVWKFISSQKVPEELALCVRPQARPGNSAQHSTAEQTSPGAAQRVFGAGLFPAPGLGRAGVSS